MISKLIVTTFIILTINLAHASGQIKFTGAITESTYRTNDIGKHLKKINRLSETKNSIYDIKNKLFNVNINYLNKEKTFAITQISYK